LENRTPADANYTNIERFCSGADVILDGLDNPETRFLLNDVSLKHGIPWVYGGAIGSLGMTMTIVPGKSACYRCVRPVMPLRKDANIPTCETAGIVGTVPAVVGALQATETFKLLLGSDEINRKLTTVDVWSGRVRCADVRPRDDCPACHVRYEALEARFVVQAVSFCGQSRAVQVVDTRVTQVSLGGLAARLESSSVISRNEYMLHFTSGENEMIVFADGRAIIKGTVDEELATRLYATHIASWGC